MVTARIIDRCLELDLLGTHKLRELRRTIHIPIAAIEMVERAPDGPSSGWDGTKDRGTCIPLLLPRISKASVRRSFWDVHNPDKAIRLKLNGPRSLFSGWADRYDEVIIEVANPTQTIAHINQVIRRMNPKVTEERG